MQFFSNGKIAHFGYAKDSTAFTPDTLCVIRATNRKKLKMIKFRLLWRAEFKEKEMSLPRKKRRNIIIEKQKFHYIINNNINVIVQSEKGEGQLLKVTGIITRDYWLDFPDIKDKENYPVLTPNDISKFIKKALLQGWEPNKSGKEFILRVDNSFINKYQIN